MIAQEGFSNIITAFIVSILLFGIGCITGGIIFYILTPLAFFLTGFVIFFFRDPHRQPPLDADNKIISPADGKVIIVKDIDFHEFIGGPSKQISIFLSPMNVHVNYVPASGKLDYLKYFPGEYLVAWHEKASDLNERAEFGVIHDSGARIFFKQITGYVARRIVFDLKQGQDVQAGQRFGIMKFGSRMDIIVAANTKIHVKPGDRTVAGESIIGDIV